MLTVRHITDTGEEHVYETRRVNFVPAFVKQCAPAFDSLWIYGIEDERAFEINGGTVYVMNSAASTVSKYALSNEPCQTGSVLGGAQTEGMLSPERNRRTAA